MKDDIGPVSKRPLIHSLVDAGETPERIERRSMELIDREKPNHPCDPDQWRVARRMIHATADFEILRDLRFSPEVVPAAVKALKGGREIFADSNMIRSGLSMARLRRVNPSYGPGRIHCHIADADVALDSKRTGLPRSLFAVRKARPMLHDGIAVFGNSPVALLELARMMAEESVLPALVLAMPVGFVHVVESKKELMALGAPYIAVEGRRGGSTLAVSAMHALCELAEEYVHSGRSGS